MTISYPNFPTYNGNLAQTIIEILLWMIEIPIIAIGNVIITVFGGAGTAAANTTATIISFPGAIFLQTELSFKAYGVLAPIIASVIWGGSIIILVFLVLKAVQIASDEITNEV